jgi:hypothetical protein
VALFMASSIDTHMACSSSAAKEERGEELCKRRPSQRGLRGADPSGMHLAFKCSTAERDVTSFLSDVFDASSKTAQPETILKGQQLSWSRACCNTAAASLPGQTCMSPHISPKMMMLFSPMPALNTVAAAAAAPKTSKAQDPQPVLPPTCSPSLIRPA